MKDFYVTTAIDYANGHPHIGHAYEKILADAIVRSRRLEGMRCHFLTGLDEHGQKVEETARAKAMEPKALCNGVAEEFQRMCSQFHVAYDDYVRTSEQRHRSVVCSILDRLYRTGEIYRASYVGMYSVRAEQFVQEKDKVNGEWPEDLGEPVQLEETNYFFRLSKYQDWLVDYLKKNPHFIFPSFRQKQVVEFLKEPINDLCISRPKSRISWGIELPFDNEYVTYVWFDALINYISAIGYGTEKFSNLWPANMQVIGKDILIPAHAIYWPIMLHALSIEPPQQLIVHGWWLAGGGVKMSKSLGNAIEPLSYGELYGGDAFRFFVLMEMATGQDSNFSHDLFVARYNSDLANGLGNLLSRLMQMVGAYCGGAIPKWEMATALSQEVADAAKTMVHAVRRSYRDLDFSGGMREIFTFIALLNRFVEMEAPWKLAKMEGEGARKHLHGTLHVLAEGIRISTDLLRPIMPEICKKIFSLLGVGACATWNVLDWDGTVAESKMGERTILFPKIEREEKIAVS
ncbi:MAG: methionine--tRNA ligase [Puniceicoccales bacterium]|jgi:methionyl-tRNA synthetase|nr:methionine--tRNA ligase [Puniceicoccales bacterium]